MYETRFEWDETKNLANRRKHGLTFTKATEAFRDPMQVVLQDRVEDGDERWQLLGVVDGLVLLLVVHTIQEESSGSTVVRIISARRATRQERRFYEDENG